MLNPEAKLNPKVLDANVEQKPIRDGYGKGIVKAGELNPNVVALCADLTESTRAEEFAKKFPDRFFEMGVAEQNMVTVAAGLGISGKIPYISSYATFSPGRNWEQIRTTVCYNDSNVKIGGHHAGVSVGPDGATHQATEDIAIMRALPNMRVFVPCDAVEAEKITLAASKIWGPVYIRYAREKSPVMTTEATPFVPGRIQAFWKPKRMDVAIFACGLLVHEALKAAKALKEQGIDVAVLNVHTIKPIDEKGVAEYAERAGAVVTVEEHQVSGGMGSTVAEVISRSKPVPMEYVGMQNTFGESGKPEELIHHYGMDAEHIVQAVKRVMRRKR